MAWPNLAENMVVEYVNKWQVNGQALYFTHHFQVGTISTAPVTIDTALNELFTQLDLAGRMNSAISGIYGANVTVEEPSTLQVIYPTRYGKLTYTPTIVAGAQANDCNVQNVSVPLEIATFAATPHGRGIKRLGGVADGVVVHGFVDPAFRTPYTDLGTELLRHNATPSGTVQWVPGLFDRVSHFFTEVTRQLSTWKAGTMKRRTVGRGI